VAQKTGNKTALRRLLLSQSVLLFVALMASPALSEELRAQADRLCHAYIERPQDFKKVEARSCEVHLRHSTQPQEMLCFKHDVDGSSLPETFASFSSGGSCSSSSIGLVDDRNRVDYPLIPNASVNGYGVGRHDMALDYEGTLLITNGNDLRLVRGNDQVILCTFMYRFEGWQAPEPENEACRKFARNDFGNHGAPIAEEAWESWPKYPEARPRKQVQADLNRDGAEETIVTYDYASGAGCGCDANPLVLFHDGELIASRRGRPLYGSAPPSIKNLGEALENLTMTCSRSRRGTAWSVVRMGGEDFVLAEYQPHPWDIRDSAEADGTVYSWGEIPSRELYELQDDKFVRICEQRPTMKKVIAHEVVPEEHRYRLNYSPSE
jgi:hypothetical protein